MAHSHHYRVAVLSIGCLLLALTSKAQFINGFGLTAGGTYARQIWEYTDTDMKLKKKYLFGLNGSAFLEFFQHDYIRWVSEIQFNQKGTTERISTPEGDKKYKNRTNYLCWNNFLKIRYEMYRIIPYILAGPRVEYLISKKPQVYHPIINDFKKLHFSWSVGAGVEFVSFGPVKFFTEAHYNPDFTDAYKLDPLKIRNQAWELRIGLKYVRKTREDCPPVYK